MGLFRPWLPLRQHRPGRVPTTGIQLLSKDKTTSRVWLGLTWPRMVQGLTPPPLSTSAWLQVLAIVSYLADTARPVTWHVETQFCIWQQRRPETFFLWHLWLETRSPPTAKGHLWGRTTGVTWMSSAVGTCLKYHRTSPTDVLCQG